jgi:hypothetical protein
MRMQSTLDLGIELVDGDRGGRQPVKQLGWGAPAAVAVATQEGGQAGLAQPLGGLRGGIALQEVQRDVAVQAGKDSLGAWPVGLQQGAELVGGSGLGLQVVGAQARDGLQVTGGGIGGCRRRSRWPSVRRSSASLKLSPGRTWLWTLPSGVGRR